jgi:hypothetical protein
MFFFEPMPFHEVMELYTEVENAKVRLPAHSPLHPRIVTATSENRVVAVVAQFPIKENKVKHFSKYKSEKPQPSPELTEGRYLTDDELEEIQRPKKTKTTRKRMRADTDGRGAALRLPAFPVSV